MKLRTLIPSDVEKIDALWQRHHKGIYGIPSRKFVITDAVTTIDDKVTSYGIVRLFAEALMYPDKDLSRFQQARSFKLLMEKAISDCKAAGLDQLNVGIKNPEFADILREKYEFRNRDEMLFKEF